MIEDVKSEITSVLSAHDARIHTIEVGFGELNSWAEKIADKANPEELWDDLSNLSDEDVQDASDQDETELSQVVQDTTKLDDDLVNPAREDQVPIEYAKLAEELGEAKGEGAV